MYRSWPPASSPEAAFWSAWKLLVPSGRKTATSPSSIAEVAGSRATPSTTEGNFAVQSRSFRLMRRTRPSSRRAMIR